MINIKLSYRKNEFRVKSDIHNYIVWKVKYKEDGSEKLSDPSYYSSFESLLRALLEEALKLSDVVTIKQLYREHQKLKQELNALLAVS